MSLLLDSYLISAAWQRWFSNFKISVELTSVRLKMSGPLQLKRQQQLLSGSSCGFRQKITRITSPSSFLCTYEVNVTNRLSIRNKVAYIIKLISFLRCWDCFFKDYPGRGGGGATAKQWSFLLFLKQHLRPLGYCAPLGVGPVTLSTSTVALTTYDSIISLIVYLNKILVIRLWHRQTCLPRQ